MLSEQLVKAGISLQVFTTTANGANELAVPTDQSIAVDGVKVRYFKRITKDHSHFSPALLSALWEEGKNFDLVHIHAWWNLVSVLSCLVAIIRNVPVLLSPRGTLSPYSFTNKNNRKKWIIHKSIGTYLLNKCHLHVTSEREKAAILQIINPKSIHILPNFIKLSVQKIAIPANASPLLKLLFFSRIEEKKGLDILLNSLSKVTVPFHLTIAGDGDREYIDRLKSIADQKGISPSLSWVGFQGTNKFDLMLGHDLMILPSHDENFGNVVIESLSMGTAVLISKYVGLAAYVAENNFGWVCDLDENDISRFINLINKENDKLSLIRQQAPAKIRNDFNEETLSRKYIDMYNQLINNA
jgi:glycosyltransferase involved in cell wall biosynthesis